MPRERRMQRLCVSEHTSSTAPAESCRADARTRDPVSGCRCFQCGRERCAREFLLRPPSGLREKATAGFWNPQMSCTPACAQLQAAKPQNGAAMRRCGQARGDTLGQPTPRGDNTTTLDRNNPENPCRVVGAQLWNMSKKVIGRSEVRLPAGTSKTSRRTARGCGEGDAAGVGGFAAFAGQESKCLGGHGWPREAPSPGALRAPTSPTRGEVVVFSALPNTSVSVKLLLPPRQSRGDSESCLASRHRVRGRALHQSSDSDSKSSSLSE